MSSFKAFIIGAVVLTCSSVVVAKKKEGDSCLARYGTEDGFDGVFHYFELPTAGGKCEESGGLICQVENDQGKIGADYAGTCKVAQCFEPLDDYEGKVTICHRTCSEKNPWIRITIDASAWVEHSCGHKVETCNGVDPSYWGDYQGDYILKVHGNRQEVAASKNNQAQEISDYWKIWEPACPSIRNGNCCSFTGPYGNTCCGRADIDPPTTASPTTAALTLKPVAPVAPTSVPVAPVASPSSAPVASPSSAPVAPVASPTSDQVVTPKCYNRRLQDMEQRWNISVPEFRYQRSLSFHLDFEISDFITNDAMITHAILDSTCTNSYTGAGLLHSRGLRLPSPTGNNKQKVGLAMWVDPKIIAEDEEIYSEGVVNNQVKANIAYCVRFSLNTPPNTLGGSLEVNFVEVIVSFDADLTDGFNIGTLSAAPYDKCEKEADEAFEVEAYFCKDGMETTPLVSNPIINQGDQLKVCVRPVQRALDQGIRLKALREFTWTLEGSAIEQEAIVDYAPASNYLTNLYCQGGHAICHFESMLYATFFQGPGRVMGSGVAEMQFGGEVSPTSVSPKTRRRLQQGDRDRRLQQGDVPAGGVPSSEFSLDTTIAGRPWDASSAGSSNQPGWMGVLSSLAVAIASTTALVLV